MRDRGDLILTKPGKIEKTNKKEPKREPGDPLFADSGRAPSSSEIPEWLQEFREILVFDRILVHGDSHASSSHEASLEPTCPRDVGICVNTVFTLISLKTEISRSARGVKLQGPRAEGAMAKPYFVLQDFGDLLFADNSRSQGPQWKLRISKQSPICSRGAGLGHSMDPSHIRAKTKNFTGNSKKLAKVFRARKENMKSFTLTFPWNSAKLVKISPGIIARPHHTDQKQTGLLKEKCAEQRKAPLLYCCNRV